MSKVKVLMYLNVDEEIDSIPEIVHNMLEYAEFEYAGVSSTGCIKIDEIESLTPEEEDAIDDFNQKHEEYLEEFQSEDEDDWDSEDDDWDDDDDN